MLLFATTKDDRSKVVSAAAQVEAQSAVYRRRAMDAIQLGSAIVVRDLLAAPTMRFIVSDIELKATLPPKASTHGTQPTNGHSLRDEPLSG